ncbi:hypothetical protein SAMN05216289_107104 [Dokdonella immobilis]|uniref:Uncharacterized protein n=1 Tax=Dokdonella immobilis TaxID=578942 RepID=A0A1I4X2Y9_9GAMM|nr:hypothetical protein SAMN05216289_107104 [Dokdonella immobilis]
MANRHDACLRADRGALTKTDWPSFESVQRRAARRKASPNGLDWKSKGGVHKVRQPHRAARQGNQLSLRQAAFLANPMNAMTSASLVQRPAIGTGGPPIHPSPHARDVRRVGLYEARAFPFSDFPGPFKLALHSRLTRCDRDRQSRCLRERVARALPCVRHRCRSRGRNRAGAGCRGQSCARSGHAGVCPARRPRG